MSLPRDTGGQRRLLDELGAPVSSPVFHERRCCPEHPEWTIRSVGLEYQDGWDSDDALWESLGAFGTTLVARCLAWAIEAVGPDGESIEARCDLAAGRYLVSVTAPDGPRADDGRFSRLRKFGRHALGAEPWRPTGGRVPETDPRTLQREAVSALIVAAEAGELTMPDIAASLGYRDVRPFRRMLGVPWETIIRRAIIQAQVRRPDALEPLLIALASLRSRDLNQRT